MKVKIYSVSNCSNCEVLRKILTTYNIQFEEVKVLNSMNTDEQGISYKQYLDLEPSVSLLEKCTFPQVYIDGKRIGNIRQTAKYLQQNENK